MNTRVQSVTKEIKKVSTSCSINWGISLIAASTLKGGDCTNCGVEGLAGEAEARLSSKSNFLISNCRLRSAYWNPRVQNWSSVQLSSCVVNEPLDSHDLFRNHFNMEFSNKKWYIWYRAKTWNYQLHEISEHSRDFEWLLICSAIWRNNWNYQQFRKTPGFSCAWNFRKSLKLPEYVRLHN